MADKHMPGTRTLAASLAVTGLLLVAGVGSATPEPSMTVDLRADGSGEMVVTSTLDLDSTEGQTAFDELRSNESVRDAYSARFQDRLQNIADSTAASTGREVTITDTSVELSRENSTGVVTMTATWDGLAAVEGDQLTLSEPFASEFATDRRFIVILPDGYELETTATEPTATDDGRIVYASGTSLDGFELVAESGDSAATDGSDTTGGSGPGFGVIASVAALAATGVLARRL